MLPYVYKLWSILLNTDNTISKEYSSIFVVADTDSYGLVKSTKDKHCFRYSQNFTVLEIVCAKTTPNHFLLYITQLVGIYL